MALRRPRAPGPALDPALRPFWAWIADRTHSIDTVARTCGVSFGEETTMRSVDVPHPQRERHIDHTRRGVRLLLAAVGVRLDGLHCSRSRIRPATVPPASRHSSARIERTSSTTGSSANRDLFFTVIPPASTSAVSRPQAGAAASGRSAPPYAESYSHWPDGGNSTSKESPSSASRPVPDEPHRHPLRRA